MLHEGAVCCMRVLHMYTCTRHMLKVGHKHKFIRICSVHTVLLAGKLTYIRQYTVCIYSYGQPYIQSGRNCDHCTLPESCVAVFKPLAMDA
jgi:hypothetical protein